MDDFEVASEKFQIRLLGDRTKLPPAGMSSTLDTPTLCFFYIQPNRSKTKSRSNQAKRTL